MDFLSQEIDDAMERLMPSSSMDDSSRSSCDVDNEKFIPAKLLSNTLQVDEGKYILAISPPPPPTFEKTTTSESLK